LNSRRIAREYAMGRTVTNLTELRDGQSGIVIGVEGSGNSRSSQNGPPFYRDKQKRRNRRRNRYGPGNENCKADFTLASCAEERCGFIQRLMDLGLTPGAKVAVIKSAPFNGPLEILLRGSRIALGRCIASRIKVEVTG
jgi:Fe2+ transport system protein FeoA